jgi:hypothetical protein
VFSKKSLKKAVIFTPSLATKSFHFRDCHFFTFLPFSADIKEEVHMPKINPSTIKWDEIDEEKSKFIYGEAVAHLDSIHNNDEFITSKAIGILSFSLPILAALTGFFVVQ